MSDRDDIDVVDKAEDASQAAAAIRQSVPDGADKKVGIAFFEKLKRAFSTEDYSDISQKESEPVNEGENLLESFMHMLKKPKSEEQDTVDNEPAENSAPVQTDMIVQDARIGEKVPDVIKEPDPEEEEEFLMISAFLEGEEYTPPADSDSGKLEYDAQSAFEDEEAVFVFETDDEESEYEQTVVRDAVVDIADETKTDSSAEKKAQSADVMDKQTEDKTNGETEGSETADGESVDNTEQTSEETNADSTDSENSETADGESVDDTEQTSEETNANSTDSENSETADGESVDDTEQTSEETNANSTDSENGETADGESVDDTEQTSEETNANSTDSENSETADGESDDDTEQTSEETNDNSTDSENSETADGESVDDTEQTSEETNDNSTDSENSETADGESDDNTAQTAEETNAQTANAENRENEDSESAENTVGIVEVSSVQIEIKEENSADNKQDSVESSDEKEDELKTELLTEEDDEEFILEEDFLFDENDEELSELAKADGLEEFGELSAIFSDDTDKEQDKLPDTKEYPARTDSAEPLEDEKAEEETNAEKSDKVIEKADEPSVEEEQGLEADEISENSVDTEKEEENTDIGEEDSAHHDETEQAISGENDEQAEEADEATGDSPAPDTVSQNKTARVKSFMKRAKNKLVELWNSKDNEEPAALPAYNEDDFIPEIDDADQEDMLTANSSEDEREDIHSDSENDVSAQGSSDQEDQQNEETNVTDETEEQAVRTPQISVITNESVRRSDVDEEVPRVQLNVIERDDTDVLTDEQKRQIEANKRVLERVQEFEQQTEAKREAKLHEAASEVSSIVTELEVTDYSPAGENEIRFTAGRFTDAVRSEYECIVNYKRMRSVSTKEALADVKPAADTPDNDNSRKKETGCAQIPEIGHSDIPELKEARDYERNHDKVDSIGTRLDYQDKRSPEPIEYRTEEDANEVRTHLVTRRRRDSWSAAAVIGTTLVQFIFTLFAKQFTVGMSAGVSVSLLRIFASASFMLFAVSVFFCRNIIIGGLAPLKKFKANSDTGLAATAAAAMIQSLLSIISPKSFLSRGINIYTLLVMLGLSAFTAGRYLDSDRIAANFRFVSDSAQKYAGKFFPDQRMVAKLLSGTKNDKTELSFQKKTSFLKHFMRLSNAEDPGDKIAASFSLPTIIFSLFIAVISGIVSKSFYDAWSVLCVMLFAGIPLGSRTLASLPLHSLAKRSLLNKSMIVGYSAIETFSESAAVMIDTKDLYPAGSIQMNDFKSLDREHWQDGLYAAAAVSIAAGGAMAGMFETIIDKDSRGNIPAAEGVMYEDGKGLVGWVRNEKICVGNRKLLRNHGIFAPDRDEEQMYRANGDEPLYIAVSGRLVGVLLVSYTANRRVADVLKCMEASEMSILVRTTDANITAERIAHDFGIGIKCIKVLEQKNSNLIRDEMIGKERTSPAFIATKGGVTSFGLAISECIQTKRNVSLSLAVEIVGALLKVLIITVIVLFAGVQYLGAVQIFVISLLWIAAVLAAPFMAQKVQRFLGN